MPELHIDAAIDFIVDHISRIELPDNPRHRAFNRDNGSDIVVAKIAIEYWSARGIQDDYRNALGEDHFAPFYDAAWELARMGILRPGAAFPKDQGNIPGFAGDRFAVTDYGRSWVQARAAEERPPRDPSRFVEEIGRRSEHFGEAFIQRAQEAAGCHRAANYLACCAMCGAAAESIILAAAVAKTGDEADVMRTYRSAGGRRKTVNKVVAHAREPVKSHFQIALDLITHWRDEAAHGTLSSIDDLIAEQTMYQLMLLARSTHDNWDELTRSS